MLGFLLVLVLVFVSGVRAIDNAFCASASTRDADFFPPSARVAADVSRDGSSEAFVAPSIAFNVTYSRSFKVVRTRSIVPGIPEKTYVLVQCGVARPTTDVDGRAFATDAQFFDVPVTSAATALTVTIGFLDELGLRDSVDAVDPGSVHAPCWQRDEETGAMLGADATANWNDSANSYDVSPAWVSALPASVTMVLTDRFGTGKTDTAKDVNFDASEAPLGMLDRLEYVKFLSLFFNKESAANAYYFDQVTRWNEMKDRIAYAQSRGRIPKTFTCAWIENESYGTDVSFKVSFEKFEKDICSGVGLTTFIPSDVASGATAKRYSTLAEFHVAIANVNVIFDRTYYYQPSATTKKDVYASLGFDQPSAAGLKVLTSEGWILRLDKRVSDGDPLVTHSFAVEGLDWFESTFSHPALVLSDLSRLIWLDGVVGIDPPQTGCARFFRNMKVTDNVLITSAADCPAYEAARVAGTCSKQLADQSITLNNLYGYRSPAKAVSVTASVMIAFMVFSMA